MNNTQKPKGNSLFLVIIFTTILFLLVIGANTLVRSSVVRQQTLLEGTRAYYAAEAGSEASLFAIKWHLPGFEARSLFEKLPHTPLRTALHLPINTLTNYFSYAIVNRTNTLPTPETGALTLTPGIPLSLPLFEDHAAPGKDVDVRDFSGNFRLVYQPDILHMSATSPCLRWDLSGFKKNTQTTESIGGVLNCSQTTLDTQLTSASYQASPFTPAQNISLTQFLQNHTQTYLTLTNLNPRGAFPIALQTNPSTTTIARPLALLISNGYVCGDPDLAKKSMDGTLTHLGACRSQQAIDVMIPQGQILPIFNYTIFQ